MKPARRPTGFSPPAVTHAAITPYRALTRAPGPFRAHDKSRALSTCLYRAAARAASFLVVLPLSVHTLACSCAVSISTYCSMADSHLLLDGTDPLVLRIQPNNVWCMLCRRQFKSEPLLDVHMRSAEHKAKAAVARSCGRLRPPPTVLCLLYTSPSPRDRTRSRMPSSA